jgi:hypothetical protein
MAAVVCIWTPIVVPLLLVVLKVDGVNEGMRLVDIFSPWWIIDILAALAFVVAAYVMQEVGGGDGDEWPLIRRAWAGFGSVACGLFMSAAVLQILLCLREAGRLVGVSWWALLAPQIIGLTCLSTMACVGVAVLRRVQRAEAPLHYRDLPALAAHEFV